MSTTAARIAEAVEAGKARNYPQAIKILEDLAAQGIADSKEGVFSTTNKNHPEIYLYLSRAWHAEKNYARAVVYGNAYTRRKPQDPAGWFFLGRTFLSLQNYEKAIYALTKSLAINEASLEAKALLGLAYLRAKKASQARAVFEEALQKAPKNTRLNTGYLNALFIEAVQILRKGDADTARQMLTFVINNNIDGVAPRLYLAHAFRALKAFPEALTQYKAALAFAPDDPALQWYPAAMLAQMGDIEGASEILSKAGINVKGDELSDQFLAIGTVRKHLEEGLWARAAGAARVYIKNFGSSAEVHLLMAEAQRNMGRFSAALNHCARAAKLEPDNPFVHYCIMLCLQQAGRWEELAQEIPRAEAAGCDSDDMYYYRVVTAAHIDNPPEQVLPHLQALAQQGKADTLLFTALGRTYVRLDMAELAIPWYQKTLEIDPDNEEAKIGLIACYEALCQNEEIHTSYQDYFSRWADNTVLRKDFIEFLQKQERWEEAADNIEILASQISGANFAPQLALNRRKAGQYRKAAILYRSLLRQKPEEKILLHNLVYCLDKMGQTKSALNLLVAARKTFGENPDTMLIEGIFYLRDKKAEDAIKTFQYILEKNPQNERAAEFLKKAYAGLKRK
ncbi:tetratricopeptide repeat protein [Treponema phagedenis]|uniref:TPR repeat-containing protein TP_0095 n=1 Tax=Treponema phagedenis TaxID=162 RepID=A0A0B7GRR9_TREPH|nr:tetratricopeptide repeat protein [Treponema phagedenis]NVP25102.1 tetratricopeptide repeat protein [Treponema phagedenis]QEJ94103.1 tetratricopeptide repeat protein [Treponema phagedenis]QEJ97215.1 tetratricopeptide repeat protein [Treponema phagedenis]QEK01886.1 tetratricopeptide repeat protein [Treponema phagedenis]QEK02592.1 tetratricopeptide repeat protein [Treponema phagedenis]